MGRGRFKLPTRICMLWLCWTVRNGAKMVDTPLPPHPSIATPLTRATRVDGLENIPVEALKCPGRWEPREISSTKP